jgi:hypothetical protein
MCAAQDESLTYSNIKHQIECGLFLKDNSTYFPYKDVEHKFFAAYQNVDMNWVAALHSMFDNPDAVIGPILFDTGCLRSCTPNLDDFVGELEYGDFGRVQTAEKDTYHTIRARGLMRLHVLDSLGRVSDVVVPANYTPDVPLRLISPQDYFQFHMMLDTDSVHFGGGAFDFTFHTAEGIKLRMRLDPGSNLPLLA